MKRVEVTAMAAGTTIEDITDVLHIIPAEPRYRWK